MWKATLLTCAVLLAAGLFANGTLAEEEPKRGGTLRIGHGFEIQGFDPFTIATPNLATTSAGSLIWPRTYQPTGDGKWEPRGVTKRTIADDGLSSRWHLRKDMKFSNGEPFTAQAIVDHWNRLLDPTRNQAFAKYISMVKKIVVIDEFTTDTQYNYPYPPAYLSGRTNSFLNSVGPVGYAEKMGLELNRKPIGPGPYMISEWKQGSSMTLVRNSYYHLKDRQYLDKIIFKQIPNREARMNALRAGDIDIAYNMNEKQVKAAEKEGNFQIKRFSGSGGSIAVMNTSRPPFDDVRVRRAMAYAVDRKIVNKVIFQGQRAMATDFWGKGSSWHCKNVDYPEYDPEKAKALLKGYGKPVKITLTTSNSDLGLLAGQLYQSFWKKVGIEVDFRQLQVGPQYIGAVWYGNYDIAFWRVADLIDPDYQVYTPFHSTSGGNVTKISNPAIDAALTKGRQSRDVALRKQAYCEFMSEMIKEMPVLLSGRSTYFVIARKGVMNLPMMHQGVFRAAEVWLKD